MASWALASRSRTYRLRCYLPHDWRVLSASMSTSLTSVTRGDPKSTCRGATDHDSNSTNRYLNGLSLFNVPLACLWRLSQRAKHHRVRRWPTIGYFLQSHREQSRIHLLTHLPSRLPTLRNHKHYDHKQSYDICFCQVYHIFAVEKYL